jgi:hypothetical protein
MTRRASISEGVRAVDGRGALLSPAEVGARLGLGKTAVARLIFIGRECRGRHPIWGGLWPVFKLGRARRVPAAAVEAHLEHMTRLEAGGAFAAVCVARAGEARFAGAGGRYRAFTAGGSRNNFSAEDGAGEVRTSGVGLPCFRRGKRKQGLADAGQRMGLSEGGRGLKGAERIERAAGDEGRDGVSGGAAGEGRGDARAA